MKCVVECNTNTTSAAILGEYSGEVLDAKITNKNGLDITDEVIDVLLASEDYEEGIKHGWFIGFLGHPEDPNCMDFRNGCIVMTSMWKEDTGKVYGKFNLVDTPVGQIVKTFIDAGVEFGISIRGAGDITNNSVEPDTFVFRGFDLVSFPAYPESIPQFASIAASTDAESRTKYKTICASVEKALPKINSTSTIDVLQSQFAPQSNVFKSLSDRKDELTATEESVNLDAEKVEAMTDLYLRAWDSSRALAHQLEHEKQERVSAARSLRRAYARKLKAIERITAAQTSDLTRKLRTVQAANLELESKNRVMCSSITKLKKENLIYQRDAKQAKKSAIESQKAITCMRSDLQKTVSVNKDMKQEASNRGAKLEELEQTVEACVSALQEYQREFVMLYASAIGIDPSNIRISADMSVSDVKQMISAATNTINIPSQYQSEETYVIEDEYEDDDYEDGIITI